MAILSFEELEEQIEKETLEETPESEEGEVVPNSELQAESVERSQETLNAVVNLDNLIAQHDEALKAIEENKKSIEDVKQLLHDSMVSTNHIVKVLTNSPLKKLAEAKKQNITFESINNDPVSTLTSFNNLLKVVRSNISQEAIQEVRRGWFEKIKTFFKTFDGEFEYYSKRSAATVKFVNSYKDKLELREDFQLSPINTILSTNLVKDVSDNYNEFIDGYVHAIEGNGKGLKFNIKNFKQIGAVTTNDTSLYPVAIDIPDEEGHENVKAYCFKQKFFNDIEHGANHHDFVNMQTDYDVSVIKPKDKLPIKNVNDMLTVLKNMDTNMEYHFKNVKLAGRRYYLSILETEEKEEKKLVYDSSKGTMEYKKINEISAKIWTISKMHNIWGEMQTAQREILSNLKVKDNVDPSTAKKIQNELELAIEGKLK